MEENSDLAKGFSKRDRSLVNSLWQELAESLNAGRPPTKDISGWKKVWAEWKSDKKKKLGENKQETRATGGGPFSKHSLTQTEEAIVRICEMAKAVDGVPGKSLGLRQEADDEQSDDTPTISSRRRTETPPAPNTPKKRKKDISQQLTSFLEEDTENKKDLNSLLGELINIQKENASNIRRVYKAIEKVLSRLRRKQ
ncbi:uncharacterized protein [Eurosta solidaginis]|uniref:uncharacterized protein n=1 Tax=Eurosta solidaginis TaxID=178769 RepID=UPI00353179A4